MFADDSGSFTCLCLDSGPSFKAQGLWRGEVELVYEDVLTTKKKKRSEITKTHPVGEVRVCSIVRKRGSTPSMGMRLGDTL